MTSTALDLDGPVALELWSTVADFDADEKGHAYAYLADCIAGVCSVIASGELHRDEWNNGVADWVHHRVDLGSVTHTVLPGHELELRLQVGHEDTWVAMDVDRPSHLEITLP